MNKNYLDVCRSFFGFQELRPHQEQVLSALSADRDCLAVLPTGSGKTLCYVLPALLSEGVTLVISPLIALIREQVNRLKELKIPAASFDSLQTLEERRNVWENLRQNRIKLLYVSPERLSNAEFRSELRSIAKISLVALDEAHCVSQWGGHFRPDYRKINQYLHEFSPVQRLALTATATAKVRADIIQAFSLIEPEVIYTHPVRDNLRIKIMRFASVEQQLTALLNSTLSLTGQGIVYAPTRKNVMEVARMLSNAGISAASYHAGMEGRERAHCQSLFVNGSVRVMVATNAYGMGVDKRNLRFVFHLGMPSSLEAYVQEIGRAGRDGLEAHCFMFYSGRDAHIQKFLIEKSFPPIKEIERVLQIMDSMFSTNHAVLEKTFLQNVLPPHQKTQDDAFAAVKFLFREGFLQKRMVRDDYGESVLLTAGSDDQALQSFLSEYEPRRQEQLAKLQVMSEFVGGGEERDAILRRYFEF